MTLPGGENVHLQSPHQAEQFRLAAEATDGEAQVRGVGGELAEGGIDRDEPLKPDFRPRVVVKLAVEEGESGRDPGGDPGGAREGDVELRVLVAIARPRP